MEGDQLHTQHRLPRLGNVLSFPNVQMNDDLTFEAALLLSVYFFNVNMAVVQALYDHLMDFLADRGVDNTFAEELMELSTAVEHQEYIKFLEELQGFVKCN